MCLVNHAHGYASTFSKRGVHVLSILYVLMQKEM